MEVAELAHLRRARDLLDREYARPLDVSAMALLRFGHLSVTDVCMAVGFTSLGSFSSTFTRLVGEPPSVYRARDHSRLAPVPPCMTRAWARPGWISQPCRIGEALQAARA